MALNSLYVVSELLYVISALTVWNMFFLAFKRKSKGSLWVAIVTLIPLLVIATVVFDNSFGLVDIVLVTLLSIWSTFANSAALMVNIENDRPIVASVNLAHLLVCWMLIVFFVLNLATLGLS